MYIHAYENCYKCMFLSSYTISIVGIYANKLEMFTISCVCR